MLDGLETVSLCNNYEVGEDGEDIPIYEEIPGWSESTVGAKSLEDLPVQARSYLERIESVSGVPIHFVSTGPDREDTIQVLNPFE